MPAKTASKVVELHDPKRHVTLEQHEAVKSLTLYEALALAQGEMSNPVKDKTVTVQTRNGAAYEYKYATLDKTLDIIRGACNRYGVFITQPVVIEPRGADGYFERLQTMATKGDEQIILSSMTLPPYTDEKTRGSQLTYFRRHEITTAFGLAGEEDTSEFNERKEYFEDPGPKTYTDDQRRQMARDKDDQKREAEVERVELYADIKGKIKVVEALGMTKGDVTDWVDREIGKSQQVMSLDELQQVAEYLGECAASLAEQNNERLQDEDVPF